jgi:hypothetical protein
MGRDTSLDDPMLRLAQCASQLFAWFDLHVAGPVLDGVHRAGAHLMCHAATDDPSHAQAARSVLQDLLTAELPVALGARAALGEACLQANEVLGDRLFLDAAHSLAEGIAHGVRQDHGGALCFSAIPGRMLAVHHANLQAAAFLARTGRRVGEGSFMALACQAAAFGLSHQRPDGGWLHGEDRPLRWPDRFHAGSRVRSLLDLAQCDVHPALHAALARALRHLVELHFDANGLPHGAKRDDEPGECELLAASEAMGALACVAMTEPQAGHRAARLAAQLAAWTSAHLQAWSLWRDPPSVHSPGRVLDALVRVQALGAGPWQGREAPSHVPSHAPAWQGPVPGRVGSLGQAATVPQVGQRAFGRLH